MLKPRPKVLYVDDNPDARTVIDSFLILHSIDVVVARNSAQARERVGWDRLDLILLDSYFGDEHGIEVCRQLRAIYPVHPLIFYTDRSNDRQRERVLDAGATEFIAAPHVDPLLTILRRYFKFCEQRSQFLAA